MQELMTDSKHLKDQQDIANACNNYFSSIVDKISKNDIDNKINYENMKTSVIKSLKTKHSHASEISTKLLKISATYMRSPLTYICNSLSGQEFFLII